MVLEAFAPSKCSGTINFQMIKVLVGRHRELAVAVCATRSSRRGHISHFPSRCLSTNDMLGHARASDGEDRCRKGLVRNGPFQVSWLTLLRVRSDRIPQGVGLIPEPMECKVEELKMRWEKREGTNAQFTKASHDISNLYPCNVPWGGLCCGVQISTPNVPPVKSGGFGLSKTVVYTIDKLAAQWRRAILGHL